MIQNKHSPLIPLKNFREDSLAAKIFMFYWRAKQSTILLLFLLKALTIVPTMTDSRRMPSQATINIKAQFISYEYFEGSVILKTWQGHPHLLKEVVDRVGDLLLFADGGGAEPEEGPVAGFGSIVGKEEEEVSEAGV